MKKLSGILKKPLEFFGRMSLKKKAIVIVIIAILLFILNLTLNRPENGYVMQAVTRETISQTVSETGNINVGAITNVVSPSTGIVKEVYVKNGENVLKGDILVKIQSTATVQEQQAAYANYLTAQNTFNTAKSSADSLRAIMFDKWDTYYNLATGDAYENTDGSPRADKRNSAEFNIAHDEWVAAEAKYKDQQVAIAQGSADLTSKWLLYQATQDAEVKSTADGTVANLSTATGNSVSSDDSLLTIISGTNIQSALVIINEIDIPKIKKGQKVKLEIDAIDGEIFEGEVARVDSVGINTQGVITYNVYVDLLVSDPRVRSGMTVNVNIETETLENALSVPNSAVKLYRGGRAVQVLEKGQPKYIPVKIGIRGNERTQILEGLEEKRQVIVGTKNALIQRKSPFGF